MKKMNTNTKNKKEEIKMMNENESRDHFCEGGGCDGVISDRDCLEMGRHKMTIFNG